MRPDRRSGIEVLAGFGCGRFGDSFGSHAALAEGGDDFREMLACDFERESIPLAVSARQMATRPNARSMFRSLVGG